ncbi:MAG: MotA/TolQ/ExbB proton channel family protein [Gammaproteobacteria bacterium]|nr:MotA/TolQ/ExbB proton channel family protein [Gammaproteobacteria bacterium]
MYFIRKTIINTCVIVVFLSVYSNASHADPIDDLLSRIHQQATTDNNINKKREKEFKQSRDRQQQLLFNAKATLSNEAKKRDQLKAIYTQQEKKLVKVENELHQRMGVLGELFGVARQVAGDALGEFENSLISAQLNDRINFVKQISKSKSLPSISELENLWFLLQQEVIESGRVTSYAGKVVTGDGNSMETNIVRVGSFNAFNQNGFLKYSQDTGELTELSVQPNSIYFDEVGELATSNGQVTAVGIDPTRGSLLSLLVQLPGLWERVKQGKLVGYIIIIIGICGLLLAVYRYYNLSLTLKKILQQKSRKDISQDNPLGRVLNVFSQAKNLKPAILEKKLDEAILREIPVLESAISTIKILAVIAPLLGLLGTVTGMIGTFQSITLFGTGDPKLMSSGISQALITTVLGLTVAIPLIFLHSLVMSKSKACILILEEQSAGLAAQHAEENQT